MNAGEAAMERLGTVGVITANGLAWMFSMADPKKVVEVFSTTEGWVKLAQIASLFAAAGWAVFQIYRGGVRLKREQKVAAWVKQVTLECEKAAAGHCPLRDELRKMELDK
jgi:hypothetical protein